MLTQSVLQMIRRELLRSGVTNDIPTWVCRSHSTDVPHDYSPVHGAHILHCNAYTGLSLFETNLQN